MKIRILDKDFLTKNNYDTDIFDDDYNLIQKLKNENIDFEYGEYCNECETFHPQDDLYYIEDKDYYVCDNCICDSSLYFFCQDCDNWYSTDTNSYETEDHRTICDDCYIKHYVECSDCGLAVHENNYYYCDDCDRYYCERCWDDHYHDDNDGLYSYHSFNNWQPHKTEDEPEPPFYIGHELEIDDGEGRRDAAELISNKINCICMEDGSLSDYGIEIISHPLSYNYMLSQENKYRDTFSELATSYNYKSHNTSDCGLHFHITRPENSDVIDRIILFMETYKEEIIRLSRRNSGEISSWCNFLSDKRTSVNEKELKSLDYIKKNKEISSRYMALNLTNTRTIEFRIFKGTLKYETFMADFEFVYFLTLLASDKNIPTEELTWERVIRNGKYLQYYCDEHDLHTNKPIIDHTQEIIIEINRKKEELQKETTQLIKEVFDRLKPYIRKTQTLNRNTLATIEDKMMYSKTLIKTLKEIMGTLEYSTLDTQTMSELEKRLENVKTYLDIYLKKEVK